MVSFRFHLISLVAVFLALSLGIGMGVTVIDKATVDGLQRSLDNVRNEVNGANQRSDELQRQLNRSANYESQAVEYLVDGKLRDTRVVFVAVRGTDQQPVNDTRELISDAGSSVQGTLWFTGKSSLDDRGVLSSLQRDLEIPNGDVNQIRSAILARVSAVLAGATSSTSLKPLVDSGVIDWQGESGNSDVTKIEFGATKIVLASGPRPEVNNDVIARPMARLLATQPTRRVVAVESGREADSKTAGERAVFLSTLRNDNDVNGKLSTVDDIETQSGQVATVLALAQLPDRIGDYGIGSGADSAIPKIRP